MRELRLVPAALLVWVVTLIAILSGSAVWSIPATVVAAISAVLLRHAGQAVLLAATGAAAALVTGLRLQASAAYSPPTQLSGILTTPISQVSEDTWLLRIRTDDYPVPVPTMLRADAPPEDIPAGARVSLPVTFSESDRAGVGEILAAATEVTDTAPPGGMAAVAALVKEKFATAVQAGVGEASQGLLPGMVLGDTTLQGETESQLYIDTGLSHLSAVSGANVAIVTTMVIVVCRLLTLGPRIQTVSAGLALLLFVGLVGTEPSVLRAAVTGLVGLLAVINSARMEPIHALCLAVIGLILVDSDLAVAYGFALSVAATAGIVALSPLLIKALAVTGWPEIIVRALAVAIAADVMTMPLVAMMAGQVSLVSVVANVVVSPAVPPVTILGLVAAGLCLLPGRLELIPLKVIEPCTWWIHHVAEWCASLPLATIATPEGWSGPAWVLVGWGWLIALLLAGHPGKVLGVIATILLWSAATGILSQNQHAEQVPLDGLVSHVVDTEDQITPVPPGTQVIIVTDPSGGRQDRPTRTANGQPVLYPNRDGPVTLHSDGSQHAVDGRF